MRVAKCAHGASPEKWMVGIRSPFLLGRPIFRGHVSFREGISDQYLSSGNPLID